MTQIMTQIKKCSKCNKIKNSSSFFREKQNKDWLRGVCKECDYIRHVEYNRTKKWLIRKILNTQKQGNKAKNRNLPTYTISELITWCMSQPCFDKLYNNWVKSWYKKMLIPSIDRLDDYKWYSLDNIQLMTWQKNKDKWHKDRKNWINNKRNKSVSQYTLDMVFIKTYHSMMQAERETWINHANIYRNCIWERKTAWKSIWKFNI